MRDLYSNLAVMPSIDPGVQGDTVTGAAVSVRDASGAMAVVNTGAVVGGAKFSAKLQESADGVSGWADVPAERVLSNAPAVLEASKSYRLGYLGKLPFIRPVLTKASGTSLAASAVVVMRPLVRPVP